VSELDLDIRPGERVLLLGASGAGKSTLIHALAGVLGGDEDGEQSGELLVDGVKPADARGRAGLVLQDPESQVILARVGDDVAFGCENLGVPRDEIWGRVSSALESVGLDLPLSHPTSQLSGGQKQRLALAGVIAMRPGLVLLDEPTANLDPAGVAEVRRAVAKVIDDSGSTLVVIEHRVAVWKDLVTRVIVLSADGGVLADGPTDVVLREHGRALADAGVWVPGHPPALPTQDWVGGDELLSARGLAIGRSTTVREGIDASVVAGGMLAITGANGSGKTTLGLTLAGLLAPRGGEVAAAPALAQGASERPIDWKSRELLTRIGTVFQEPEHQFLASTVRAELEIGPRALGITGAPLNARVGELLARLRLEHLAAANPFTLSGGEKRRLSVATVLATRPRVIVLDEPTFGQDSCTWSELVAILAELLSEGCAIVAISHDAEFVAALTTEELRL
jgi:energy-coupling factor transport system ATP-binding protein